MVEIRLSKDFSKELAELKRREDGDSGYILRLIEKGIARLSGNHKAGQKIQKRLWPRYYSHKYGISNLWRLRLDDHWRLIYTLTGNRIRIIAVILEVLDHGSYDKRFGYKQ